MITSRRVLSKSSLLLALALATGAWMTGCGSSDGSGVRAQGAATVKGLQDLPFEVGNYDQVVVGTQGDGSFIAAVLGSEMSTGNTTVEVATLEPDGRWSSISGPKPDGQFGGAALVRFGPSVALLGELCPRGMDLEYGCPGDARIVGWVLGAGRWTTLPSLEASDSAALRQLYTSAYTGSTSPILTMLPRGVTDAKPEVWQLREGAGGWKQLPTPPLGNPGVCEEGTGSLVAFGTAPGTKDRPPAGSVVDSGQEGAAGESEPALTIAAATLAPKDDGWHLVAGTAPADGHDPVGTGLSCGTSTAAVASPHSTLILSTDGRLESRSAPGSYGVWAAVANSASTDPSILVAPPPTVGDDFGAVSLLTITNGEAQERKLDIPPRPVLSAAVNERGEILVVSVSTSRQQLYLL